MFALQTGSRRHFVFLAALLIVQLGLLGDGIFRFTPVEDEPGHLVAGISHWQYRDFGWYQVNPPLPRMMASVVPYLLGERVETPPVQNTDLGRPAIAYGREYFRKDPQKPMRMLQCARLVSVIWPLLATYVIFVWSSSVWGYNAGVYSAAIWIFSPLVIANSQLSLPDVASASSGLLAGYAFSIWLRKPTWEQSVWVGLALGVAQLTKFTLIIFVPLYLVLWCIHSLIQRISRRCWLSQTGQLFFLMTVALIVINSGYSFKDTGVKLKDYRFFSSVFTNSSFTDEADNENRFRNSWLGEIPVPLPKSVLLGIDLQQRDFEGMFKSFLRGEERDIGWLYYYLYAYAIKEPFAYLLILAMALCSSYRTFRLESELILVVIPVAIFTVVSVKTGFNHHLRYVLPAIPFMSVWCGRIMSAHVGQPWLRKASIAILLFGICESLSACPYFYAHFNFLIGGSVNGYKHLAVSNLGWGQEAHLVPELRRRYPEILIVDDLLPEFDRNGGSDLDRSDLDRLSSMKLSELASLTEQRIRQIIIPGIYAVPAAKIGSPSSPYFIFSQFEPERVEGFTVRVYRIHADDITRIVRALKEHTVSRLEIHKQSK